MYKRTYICSPTKQVKDLQAMKTYPKGTTKEQWDQYEIDLKRHEERVERQKPQMSSYGYIGSMPPDAQGERAYCNAYAAWDMMRSMDAPNIPGYYRANND